MSKENGSIPNHFYLVFDFIDNDLAGIVRAINPKMLPTFSLFCIVMPSLSCCVLQWYIYQIVSVLDFLHGSHIIHRDIKLDNFLVTNDHHIYLSDFGLSRLITSSSRLSFPAYAMAYRSPEILLEMQPYTMAADIWALGVLIATILVGRTLFVGTTDVRTGSVGDWVERGHGRHPRQVRRASYEHPKWFEGVETHHCH